MKCPDCDIEMEYSSILIPYRMYIWECPKCGKQLPRNHLNSKQTKKTPEEIRDNIIERDKEISEDLIMVQRKNTPLDILKWYNAKLRFYQNQRKANLLKRGLTV